MVSVGLAQPAGREQRAAGDMQVGEAVDPPPAVGDAAARIAGHAGRAHMVEAADRMRADQLVADPALVRVASQPAGSTLPRPSRRDSRSSAATRPATLSTSIADSRQSSATRGMPMASLLAAQHHPAVRVGRLLGADDQRQVEPAEPLHQPGMERAGQAGVAAHQLLGRLPHRAAGAGRRGAMLDVEIGALGQRMAAAFAAGGRRWSARC